MKKITIFALILCVVSTGAMTAYGSEYNALRKFGRGVANMVTCPVEVLRGLDEAYDDKGPFAALTWGFANGVYRTFKRAFVGVYETVTFPVPLPWGYEPIIKDPEFILQEHN